MLPGLKMWLSGMNQGISVSFSMLRPRISLILLVIRIIYYRDDENFSMQAEKDERFRSESKKKAVFNCFNFDMGNVSFI